MAITVRKLAENKWFAGWTGWREQLPDLNVGYEGTTAAEAVGKLILAENREFLDIEVPESELPPKINYDQYHKIFDERQKASS